MAPLPALQPGECLVLLGGAGDLDDGDRAAPPARGCWSCWTRGAAKRRAVLGCAREAPLHGRARLFALSLRFRRVVFRRRAALTRGLDARRLTGLLAVVGRPWRVPLACGFLPRG